MAWIAGAAAVAGSAMSASSQSGANKMNLAIAREQMRFQERMSSTAYQRAAGDLENAGLNRILALGNSASSPAGASAVMQRTVDPDSGEKIASSAMNAKRLKADMDLMKSTDWKTRAEAATTDQLGAESRTRQLGQTKQNKILDLQMIGLEVEADIDKSKYGEWARWLNRGTNTIGSAVGIGAGATGGFILGSKKARDNQRKLDRRSGN